MPVTRSATADAAPGGVRLTLPLTVGTRDDVVELEPAHLEWLARIVAYAAVRDGLLGMPAAVTATLRPGRVREWHGPVRCLTSFVVELHDECGRSLTCAELPREVLYPFALGRAAHLADAADARAFAWSLHASAGGDAPWPVRVPALPHLALDALAAGAVAVGRPAREWIATFVAPDVIEGFGELERASRERGVETAGRMHARIGFDREARTFVRVLERLVVTRDTVATAASIVSTAASWGGFLASAPTDAPTASSHVHTHLHLAPDAPADGSGSTERLLGVRAKPLISVSDRVTHLTTFTDPLAASVILSLYPSHHIVTLYGYTPWGTLAEEPGYWRTPT